MTFDDIPLLEAIHDVYQRLSRLSENGEALGPGPRADYWLRDPGREILCRLIIDSLALPYVFKLNVERITAAWATYGRTGNKEEFGKPELLVLAARAHGRTCFYACRGLGECSPEVTLDRLIPGSRGGTYTVENVVLACARHNRERQDLPIEEYLARGTST